MYICVNQARVCRNYTVGLLPMNTAVLQSGTGVRQVHLYLVFLMITFFKLYLVFATCDIDRQESI